MASWFRNKGRGPDEPDNPDTTVEVPAQVIADAIRAGGGIPGQPQQHPQHQGHQQQHGQHTARPQHPQPRPLPHPRPGHHPGAPTPPAGTALPTPPAHTPPAGTALPTPPAGAAAPTPPAHTPPAGTALPAAAAPSPDTSQPVPVPQAQPDTAPPEVTVNPATAGDADASAAADPAEHPGQPDASVTEALLDQALAERRTLVQLCLYALDRARSTGVTERIEEALQSVGVTALRPDGARFDPAHHEAGGTVVTDDADLDGTVAETEVVGFADRGTTLRVPIVTVYTVRAQTPEEAAT